MRNALLTALAAATILLGGMLATRTEAMTAASAAGTAATGAGFVKQAAVVCGGNGCGPVQTKPQRRRKLLPLGHG